MTVTAETETAPLCANPACGKLRRLRPDGRLGGTRGWCESCSTRWYRAGMHGSGPPPVPVRSRSQEAARRRKIRQFAALTADGRTLAEAARDAQVSKRTAERYSAALRDLARTADPVASVSRRGREWEDRAACASENPELFYGPDADDAPPPYRQELTADRVYRENAALLVCGSCPVRRECLEHALAAGEEHGIWGGTTEAQRRDMQREEAA